MKYIAWLLFLVSTMALAQHGGSGTAVRNFAVACDGSVADGSSCSGRKTEWCTDYSQRLIYACSPTTNLWTLVGEYGYHNTISNVTFGTGASNVDIASMFTINRLGTDTTVSWKDTDVLNSHETGLAWAFNGSNIRMDATAAGVKRGIYWPYTNPNTSRMFLGGSGTTFNQATDNVICRGYNTDCGGSQFLTTDYAFNDVMEGSYDYSATAGNQMKIEMNWNFTPANQTYSWRPFTMELDTTTNSGDGSAYFAWQANDTRGSHLNDPSNVSAMYVWPRVYFNAARGTDNPARGAANFFQRQNDMSAAGTNPNLYISTIYDYTPGVARFQPGIDIFTDLTPVSTTSSYVTPLYFPAPSAFGSGSTIATQYDAIYMSDQNVARTGFPTAASDMFYAESQTVANGNQGNFALAGTGYNHGHIKVGSTHIWEKVAGQLRIKGSTPTSDGDGNGLLNGTGNSGYGVIGFANNSVTCTATCTAIGNLSCGNAMCVEPAPGAGQCTGVGVYPAAVCANSDAHRICFCY